jgi:hypothetical protein
MKKYCALKELSDCDYKTQMAKGYGNIPKYAEVEFVRYIQNLYGNYMRVRYKGIVYDVRPEDIVIIEE